MKTVKTIRESLTPYSTKATAVRGAKRANERFASHGETDCRAEVVEHEGSWCVAVLKTLEVVETDYDDAPCSTNLVEKEIVRQSTCDNPTKLVWCIADELTKQGKSRKEIIEACVAAGVAYYTARTQYQHFYTVNKGQNK